MAFISLIFVFIFLCLVGLGVVGLILLLVGLLIRARNKKKMKKSKVPIVLIVLGIIFLIPAGLIIILIIAGDISSGISNRKNLDYQVKYGTAGDVNARDYCGETALIYAASPTGYSDDPDDQIRIAELLLENGADKDVSGKYSGTALERAAERDWQEMIELLTE